MNIKTFHKLNEESISLSNEKRRSFVNKKYIAVEDLLKLTPEELLEEIRILHYQNKEVA